MFNLNDLTSVLESEILINDVNQIMLCYENDQPSLTFSCILMPKHSCNNSQILYQKIIGVIRSQILMDVMPLIDEYLEYVSVPV